LHTVYSMQSFNRANISDDLIIALRDMIVDGELPAGERINEVALASRLGVSRTPLREALGRLAAEEALTAVPRIGYFVRPLTVEELEQIYPIRWLLDPEALRLAGLPTEARLKRLEELNRLMLAAKKPEDVLTIDDTWHLELIADCPNQTLINLIKQFIWRTRRYELALMRERRNVVATTHHHERVMKALRANDLDGACDALRSNMKAGREPIIEWLNQRQEKSQDPKVSSPRRRAALDRTPA
jgi:DNA-binding GntR family transcriptional regulator